MALRKRQPKPPGPQPCGCAGRVAELADRLAEAETTLGALVQATVKFARLAKGDSIERGLARGGLPADDAARIAQAYWARHQ